MMQLEYHHSAALSDHWLGVMTITADIMRGRAADRTQGDLTEEQNSLRSPVCSTQLQHSQARKSKRHGKQPHRQAAHKTQDEGPASYYES